jgi:hypothetical protein
MNLWKKLCLCWRILREKTNSLMAHAIRELPSPNGDEMQELINDQILEIVLVFSTHGHGACSAPYASALIDRLLRFEPLSPLTGEDAEWNKIGEDTWQNRRCGHVFKDATGAACNIEGRVFVTPNGEPYTNRNSCVPVTFPYTPKTEYVKVDADGQPTAGGDHVPA